ncbi:hypothetical protein AAULR_12672, partial [Lacticaseibacillus rhamnosus MTCC 5462]
MALLATLVLLVAPIAVAVKPVTIPKAVATAKIVVPAATPAITVVLATGTGWFSCRVGHSRFCKALIGLCSRLLGSWPLLALFSPRWFLFGLRYVVGH